MPLAFHPTALPLLHDGSVVDCDTLLRLPELLRQPTMSVVVLVVVVVVTIGFAAGMLSAQERLLRLAAPGEVVTVRVPGELASAGWRIRIGAHSDHLWHLDSWKRFPDVTRTFAVKAAETPVACAFGGLIYVDTPKASDTGEVKVEFTKAVRAPHYVHSKTTLAEWKELRAAPAPWGELETKKIVLTLPASVLRTLDDPVALMKTWDETLDLVADLATIPKDRPRAERIVCDEQISAGYMHSGYPIMTWLDMPPRLVREAHMRKGDWGIGHELGHNHQSSLWTYSGYTEVTNNLFSLYCMEKISGKKLGEGHGEDLAIMAAGCVTVPTYTTNTERDHTHIIENSGARAIIVSTQKLAATLMPAALRSTHVLHRENFGRTPTIRPMGSGRELHAQRKDGATFPVEISLSPLALLILCAGLVAALGYIPPTVGALLQELIDVAVIANALRASGVPARSRV